MDVQLAVTVVIGLLVLATALTFVAVSRFRRSRRSLRLREQFGEEYQRAVAESGDRHHAEQRLNARIARVEAYELWPLEASESQRFTERWSVVRASFIDDPHQALVNAEHLLIKVMRARGFEDVGGGPARRAADLSVGHSDAARAYRQALDISRRDRDGEATTEDLRDGMQRYGEAFVALLEPETLVTAEPEAPRR